MRARALCALFLLLAGSAATTGCSSLFYQPNSHVYVDTTRLTPLPEEVQIPVAGETLHGWYFRTKAKAPRAVILVYHGNAQNLSSHFFPFFWLIDHPYDLFIFDYEGYGKSTGHATQEHTVRDGAAALDWLHRRNPKLPIVVYGQSLGGAIAQRNLIDLAGKYPVKLAVLDSTFTSYQKVGRRILARGWLSWPFQWLAWLALSDQYAPEGELGKLPPLPLLVIHGTADQVVPYSCGEDLFAEAAEPKEFWRIPGGRHNDIFSRAEYRQRFLDRLAKALADEQK